MIDKCSCQNPGCREGGGDTLTGALHKEIECSLAGFIIISKQMYNCFSPNLRLIFDYNFRCKEETCKFEV